MKFLKKYFLTASIILLCNTIFSQTRVIDSLKKVLLTAKADTNKVNTLDELAWELNNTGYYANGLTYANKAFELAAKINFKKGMAKAKNTIGIIYDSQGNYPEALKEYFSSLKTAEVVLSEAKNPSEKQSAQKQISSAHNNIGLIYYNQGNYPKALKEHFSSLKIREEIGDKQGVAASHNNIGIIYKLQGNYPEALKEYFSSLKIREEIGDKQGIATSHNNIGNIYTSQGNYPEALKEYFFALKIKEEIGDKYGIANSHGNIGNIYHEQASVASSKNSRKQLYDKALKEYFFALKIREEIGDKYGIATSHNNIGIIYSQQGNYPEANPTERNQSFIRALKECLLSLKIFEEIGDKNGIAASHINIGTVYIKQNKAGEGKKELETALEISREIGSKDAIRESYNGLSQADSALGNYKGSLESYKLFIIYRDSLTNEENTKKTVQQQMQFEFDKTQAADSIKNKEHQKQEQLKHNQEIQQQKIYTYGGVIGFLLMIIVAGVSFRAFRNKQKANEIISAQKQLVEMKQSEIIDSIRYASRIQKALLPSNSYIKNEIKRLYEKK